MNKGGFSWKRFCGITKYKSNLSRMVGIPLTKSGRQRKAGSGSFLAMLATLFLDRRK